MDILIQKSIRYMLARFKILSCLFMYYTRITSKYPKSISKRQVDLFDYNILAEPCINDKLSLVRDNNLYGIEEVISTFLDVNINNVFFEHGLIFGSLVTPNTKFTFADKIITFGLYRKEFLSAEVKNKKIILIGPYIHYAENIYDEKKLKEFKNDLGRVLLIFPSHSTQVAEAGYDLNQFGDFIASISNGFDSVLVCLYWKDILLGKNVGYEKLGYRVVCAGHNRDSNFLNRLKTIIDLSDYVVANDIGTFIGYSIYLNKPVYIFNQELTDIKLNKNFELDRGQRGRTEWDDFESIKKIIKKTFGVFSDEITPEQYDLCNYIWGFDEIKTKEQLLKLLDNR